MVADPPVLLAFAGGWALLLVRSRGPSSVEVAAVFLTFQGLGVATLAARAGDLFPARVFAAGFLAYATGVWVARRRSAAAPRPAAARSPGTAVALVTLAGVAALSVYHFAVAGITLLSPDVDLERFDTLRSGAFGVPRRAVDFGLPLVALFATVRLHRAPDRTARLTATIAWALLALGHLLAGSKGALVWVGVLWIVAAAHDPRARPARRWATAVGLAVLGIGAAALLHGLYRTGPALLVRVTETGGLPFHFVVTRFAPSQGIGFHHFANDVAYVLGLLHLGPGTVATTNQSLSMAMHPGAASTVPVTPTILGSGYLVAGLAGVVVAGFLAGALAAWLVAVTDRVQGILAGTLALAAEWTLVRLVTRGNPVFLTVNTGYGIAVFILCLAGSVALVRLARSAVEASRRGVAA